MIDAYLNFMWLVDLFITLKVVLILLGVACLIVSLLSYDDKPEIAKICLAIVLSTIVWFIFLPTNAVMQQASLACKSNPKLCQIFI